jgi:hypothetical protein
MEAEDFIPNQPLPSTKKPQLILSSFGLALVKPKFYKQGQRLNLLSVDDELRPTTNKGTLGLPVFGGIVFKAGSYVNNNGETINYGKEGAQDLLIECCLIEVGQQRQIVSTKIQGKDASVKQFISNGDYGVTIRGVLASSIPNVYPDSDMRALQTICNAEVAVSVQCPYLEDFFQIGQIVVQYANFPQLEGNITVQPFELRCLSDEPIILKTKDA